MAEPDLIDLDSYRLELTAQAAALGFAAVGGASIEIPEDERHLLRCPGCRDRQGELEALLHRGGHW